MSRQRNRRVMLSSSAGLIQRAMQLLTTLITLPLVLHALGVAGFGVWGAATSLAGLAGMLDLGLGAALLTLVPESIAAGELERARDYVTVALVGGFVLTLLIMAGGFTLVLSSANPANAAPLLVAVTGIALFVPLGIARNVWFGLQQGYVSGFWDITQTALLLTLLLTAVALHGGVFAMTLAVYGSMTLCNTGCLVHLFIHRRDLQPRWRIRIDALVAVLRKGGMLFCISVAVLSSYGFDNLLTLHWLGAAASAQMAIASRLCVTALGIIAVAVQPLWPAFVEAAALGDRAWEWRALGFGSLLVVVLICIGAGIIVLFGQHILDWWLRENVGIGQVLLWSIVGWIAAFAVPAVAGMLLNAMSILRFQVAVSAVAAGVALGLKHVLAANFGVAGILLSSALAWIVVIWPAYGWRVWWRIAGPYLRMKPV